MSTRSLTEIAEAVNGRFPNVLIGIEPADEVETTAYTSEITRGATVVDTRSLSDHEKVIRCSWWFDAPSLSDDARKAWKAFETGADFEDDAVGAFHMFVTERAAFLQNAGLDVSCVTDTADESPEDVPWRVDIVGAPV
jgi:hypothetical protein